MARRNGPELYELLAKAKQSGADPGGAVARSSGGPAFDRGQLQWIVAIAAILAIAVISYLVGVARGERIGRAALAAEREEELRLLEEGRPASSLVGGSSDSASTLGQVPPSENGGAPAPIVTTPRTSEIPSETGMGRDPRVSGLNYFVIASGVLEERVPEILGFCRSKGLDAWVVPDQNGRLREITVLPGFEGSRRSAPEVKELEAKIRRVGLLWKAAGRNNQDFGGAYPKRFNG